MRGTKMRTTTLDLVLALKRRRQRCQAQAPSTGEIPYSSQGATRRMVKDPSREL